MATFHEIKSGDYFNNKWITEIVGIAISDLEAQGRALKEQLRQRFDTLLPGRPGLVRELIAEAEARAWETPFPHLFLPDFAELRLAEVLATQQQAFIRAA